MADALLIFENHSVMYYPFGYGHYLERKRKSEGEGGLAAQVKAEEQALIAGIRAVPKAERHRLKEISAEEAYIDWRLRLVSETMIPAGEGGRAVCVDGVDEAGVDGIGRFLDRWPVGNGTGLCRTLPPV